MALTPPEELAREHDDLVAAIDHAVDGFEAARTDPAAAERMLSEGPPLDPMAEAATAIGAESCAG